MSKPVSRVKKVVRELQLVLSVGAGTLIVYAVCTSTLAMHLQLPPIESASARQLLGALLALGPLMLLAPAICFVVRLAVELDPWRLGLGTAAFVEAALLLLRWDTGELELFHPDFGLIAQLLFAAAAGVLASLAAREAARRMSAREALPATTAAAPAADLAEEMRKVQQAARDSDQAPR